MAKTKNVAAVIEIIEKAARNKGWSYSKLTRHLKKGENTLLRWRSGNISSFDIDALVQLFEIAGESMDQTFGLQTGADVEPTETEVAQIHARLDELESIKRILQAFAVALGASGSNCTPDEIELRKLRAAIPSGESFRASVGKVNEHSNTGKRSAKSSAKVRPA